MKYNPKPYSDYRTTTIPWVEQIPSHWKTYRLQNIARVLVSNVDKLSDPTEIPVRLCNYVDVYKYNHITEQINFMKATASRIEIDKFRLKENDVLITKDSEMWNDIGVPALVKYAAEDLVSGYHLAILRANQKYVLGEFIFWLLQGMEFKYQFHVAANGVTRYGLPTSSIKNLIVCIPPLEEQQAIVRFLDHTDRLIRRYIRAKQKQIKLLEEQKQAIIHQAVTHGLNPEVRLKPSGIEWLGDIPEKWEVNKLKYEMSFYGGGTPSKANASYWKGAIPWVSPKDMKSDIISDSEDHITMEAVEESSSRLILANTILLVVRSGILQRTIPIALNSREVAINQDMKALVSRGHVLPEYFIFFVKGCEKNLLIEWTKQGATVESIEHQYLANSKMLIPPINEQINIIQYLADINSELSRTTKSIFKEINLLQEYRTRLIADIVTGKLDVREVSALLPVEEETQALEIIEELLSEDMEEQGEIEPAELEDA